MMLKKEYVKKFFLTFLVVLCIVFKNTGYDLYAYISGAFFIFLSLILT